MTSLSDLPEQESAQLLDLSPLELARLLDVSVIEARGWLEQTEPLPFMQLTVKAVQRLRESGNLYKEFPELIRVPEDVGARWRQLKKLFLDDPELRTGYPEAHELLFGEEAVDDKPLPYHFPLRYKGCSWAETKKTFKIRQHLDDLYLLGGRQWPYEPELDNAQPVVLDNGQVLRLRLTKKHMSSYLPQSVEVLEFPSQKGMAILAALTALEGRPVDIELLCQTFPLLEPSVKDGLQRSVDEARMKSVQEKRRDETSLLYELEQSSSPWYVMFLLRCYRPEYFDYPHEEQLSLIQEGCERVNKFLIATRLLAEFLGYGSPNRDQRKAVEYAVRDVEAACLKDFFGMPLPQIAERMRDTIPSKVLERGDYSTVSKIVKSGRDICERAWGKEGWRKHIEAERAKNEWAHSIPPRELQLELFLEREALLLDISPDEARRRFMYFGGNDATV